MSACAGGAEQMFLDVRELAVRKLRIHKTYAPGSIDFHSAEIKQIEPLEVTATAELLEGQIRVEGNLDANLSFQQFRGGSHFQWLNLFDFRRMEVDAARCVGLVDAELADSQFPNVQEHLFSASGARAHALPLFRGLSAKSRNGRQTLLDFAPFSSPFSSSTHSVLLSPALA